MTHVRHAWGNLAKATLLEAAADDLTEMTDDFRSILRKIHDDVVNA
jgi:hypothetical protein